MKKNSALINLVIFGVLTGTMPAYGAKKVALKNKPISVNAQINILKAQQFQMLQTQERQQQDLQKIAITLKKLTGQESMQTNAYSYP
ncbi:MAG: hypothetical protein ACOH2B_03840 [Burkholderiaceae bacterium]